MSVNAGHSGSDTARMTLHGGTVRTLTLVAAGAAITATVMMTTRPAMASSTQAAASQAAGDSVTIAPAADPNTTVTFTVSVGALSLSAPATSDLGGGNPGTTISGVVSPVVVTDDRALLSATWTATAAESAFTTGGSTAAETIPAADATYAPGTITTTGTITATGSTITLANAPATVVAGSAGVGDNSASWSAGVSVAVPAGAVGGPYTGTLTQSVS
jgi:hypothetical protein